MAAYDQHGAMGVDEDLARHAAEQQARQAAETARSDGDQVGALVLGGDQDLASRIATAEVRGGGDPYRRQPLRHRVGIGLIPATELATLASEALVAEGIEADQQLEGGAVRYGDRYSIGQAVPEGPPPLQLLRDDLGTG